MLPSKVINFNYKPISTVKFLVTGSYLEVEREIAIQFQPLRAQDVDFYPVNTRAVEQSFDGASYFLYMKTKL